MSLRRKADELCPRIDPLRLSRWEFILHGPVAFVFFAVVYRGVVHELGHGLINGLTGGTYGLTSEAGNLIGGYSIIDIYLVQPVFAINVAEYGTWPSPEWARLMMILGGPWIIIVSFWVAVYFVNPVRFPCGKEGDWKYYKGAIWGLFFAALADSIYTGPVDPFANSAMGGDGVAIYELFKELGMHLTLEFTIAGVTISQVVNPGYVVMAGALLGTFAGMLLLFGISPRQRVIDWVNCTIGNVCRI